MRQREEAVRTGEPAASAVSVSALRDRIAKIAAGTGGERFFSQDSHGLSRDHAASKLQPVPLGRDSRFDRLLGGGIRPGTLTEILPGSPGDVWAASGFLLSLAIRLAARPGKERAAIIWIAEAFSRCEQGAPYGPGLALHGLDPSRLVLVTASNAQQALWAMEEALKCRAPALVIGELWSAKSYDLTASRRLLLAAQKHGTPALLFLTGLAGQAEHLSSGADQRFEIRAHPSVHPPSASSLPLPGAARWAVRIAKLRIKARAGPGTFIDRDRFHPLLWDHDEALFRDALSLAVAADASDRPDHPVLAQG